ncbi:hypothetical protein D3C81_1230450 [compost metagenome]
MMVCRSGLHEALIPFRVDLVGAEMRTVLAASARRARRRAGNGRVAVLRYR